MKTLLIPIYIILLFGFSQNSQVSAKGIPFLLEIETKAIKAFDIPKKYNWKSANLEYMHVGYEYQQVQFLWIPVWNSKGRYLAWVDTGKGKALNIKASSLESIMDLTGKSYPSRT